VKPWHSFGRAGLLVAKRLDEARPSMTAAALTEIPSEQGIFRNLSGNPVRKTQILVFLRWEIRSVLKRY
jgi:hypothetical protein